MSFDLMCNTTAVIRKSTIVKVEEEDTKTFVDQAPISAMFDKLSGQRVYINQTTGKTILAYCRVDINTDATEEDHIIVNGREWIIDDIDDSGLRGWCKTLKLANV